MSDKSSMDLEFWRFSYTKDSCFIFVACAFRFITAVPACRYQKIICDISRPDTQVFSFFLILGERPAAYIIILGDTNLKQSFGCDHGIAAQSILLGATEKGLGGCTLASIQRQALSLALTIPNHYEILLVIALGKPKETVVIEEVGPTGDIKYWRDTADIHHVPKRSLDDLIMG
jgi:hypothetical protein